MMLMRSVLGFLILTCLIVKANAQSKTSDYQEQIDMAMLAAPDGSGEEAHIYGYDKNGKLITLREGTNDFYCISDNPNRDGFEVVCYHKQLEPFMARGRELRAEGKGFAERSEIRESEAKNGELKMPSEPSTLIIYYGGEGEFDESTKTMKGANYRYVVYIPFATQKSTGLPLKANAAGHPWLMDPGKHNAHIMITPPPKN